MYPYIHITLPSYTVMAFLGGFVSLLFLYLGIDKYKLDFSVFLKLFLASALGGFAGSKLLFAVTQIPWILRRYFCSSDLHKKESQTAKKGFYPGCARYAAVSCIWPDWMFFVRMLLRQRIEQAISCFKRNCFQPDSCFPYGIRI